MENVFCKIDLASCARHSFYLGGLFENQKIKHQRRFSFFPFFASALFINIVFYCIALHWLVFLLTGLVWFGLVWFVVWFGLVWSGLHIIG